MAPLSFPGSGTILILQEPQIQLDSRLNFEQYRTIVPHRPSLRVRAAVPQLAAVLNSVGTKVSNIHVSFYQGIVVGAMLYHSRLP